jgi:hypothetical protein
MTSIAISYRRSDSGAMAGRIRDRLAARYGEDSMFMDIDSIPYATDFREHIRSTLLQCDVLLVVIGPHWVGQRQVGGTRINDIDDPVRMEVEIALQGGVKVLPVLVSGAAMPAPTELPEPLRKLTYLNAAEVAQGRDFGIHVERLERAIDQMLGPLRFWRARTWFTGGQRIYVAGLAVLALLVLAVAVAATWWPGEAAFQGPHLTLVQASGNDGLNDVQATFRRVGENEWIEYHEDSGFTPIAWREVSRGPDGMVIVHPARNLYMKFNVEGEITYLAETPTGPWKSFYRIDRVSYAVQPPLDG